MGSAKDIIPSYSFEVSLDGIKFSFSKIENISSSIDIDTIVDGGNNNAPVILRKPKTNPDVLVLQKGMYTSMKDCSFALLKEGTKIGSINISVLRNGSTVRMFFITNGVIVKREFSPLDSLESAVMIECLQIVHTGLTEIPLPFALF